jgi:protein involved in ribonucleotide reduction
MLPPINVSGTNNAVSMMISVTVNQAAASQTAQALKTIGGQITTLHQQVLSLKTAGRDLREVGGYIAAGGAAMLAPFILAANQYEQKYARLEPIANAYAIAQKRQADATIQLGRVGAQALTPFLNQVADVEKRIADFATAHPDLVQAVVGGGAVLATVGTGMAAVGQVMVTVANAAKLLGVQAAGVKTLFGNLATAAGAVGLAFGLLQVAVPLTIAGINAFGKAINDPRLAHITLADVLDTGGQVIALAIHGLAEVFTGIAAGLLIIKAQLDHFNDPSWNTPTGDKSAQLSFLAQSLGNASSTPTPRLNALGLPVMKYSASAFEQLKSGITSNNPLDPNNPLWMPGGNPNMTPDLQAKLAAIKTPEELAAFLMNNASGLKLSPQLQDFLDKARKQPGQGPSPAEQYATQVRADQQKLMGGIDTSLAGGGHKFFLGGGLGPGGGGGGTDTVAETTNAFIAMEKANAQTDIQLAQEKLAAETSYKNESLKLEISREAQIKLLLADQNRARIRAVADFNHSEMETEKRLAFERQQQLYTMQLQANELAIQGDVAGFISAQIQNRNTILEQNRQNAFDKQQRKEQFDYQQAQTEAENKVALDQMRAQFGQEDIARREAYREQLAALKTSHDNQQAENERAFALQYAAIVGNNSDVGKLYSDWMLEQEKKADAFLKRMNLVPVVATALGIPNILVSPYTHVGGGNSGLPPGVVPSFASGSSYVPQDMLARIHQGERIIPAHRNYGGGGMSVSFDFSGMRIGDGVSESTVKAHLQDLASQVVNHMDSQLSNHLRATQ